MKVSICMITYNHEKFIREAIEGVLMQDCDFKLELIVVNDCSLDNTDKIIKDIILNHPRGNWIKYIKQEENIGMMPNFIFALQQCNGQYIALCEGDDYWIDSLKLQKQVDFLEENPDYVLTFHQVNILKINGEIVDDFITSVPENYENIDTLARLGNYIHTPSVVFRNVIREFPLEFEHTPIGDYFLYMMLAEYGKLKYLEDKMAVYRYGVGFFSVNSNLITANSILKLFTCLLSYLKNEEIKKIIFERQLQAIYRLENLIVNQYKGFFISKNIFFRIVKFVQDNYRQPSQIIKKIIYESLK